MAETKQYRVRNNENDGKKEKENDTFEFEGVYRPMHILCKRHSFGHSFPKLIVVPFPCIKAIKR